MSASFTRAARTEAALHDVTSAILLAAIALRDEGYDPDHAADVVAVAVKRGLSLLLLAEEAP